MSNFSFPFFGPAPPSDTAPTSPGSAPTSSASRPAQTPVPPPSSSLTSTSQPASPTPTSTPSPTSTSASPPPTSTSTTTNPIESSSPAPVPSPTAVPVPNSNNTTPNQTTVLRTVTRDGQASIVVITQTLPPNPTTTSPPNPNNRKNEDSGSVLPIAIPCAIAGLIALVGLGLLIRWLKNRSAAARAAEDIKWPEVINSDGDRAALYPEPTRPGMGHGLGDEDEDAGMSGAQMGEAANFAGAGAGNRATMRPPSNLSPHNTGSATTYLNSSSIQDHNSSLQHFYSTNPFPGPPAPQVSAPQAAYGYYNSTSPPQAYPSHPNALVPGGALHGPREIQQAYGTTEYYNTGNQDYPNHHHHQEKYYSKSQDHDQDYELDDYPHHQEKQYDDPLPGKEGAAYTTGHPIHDQYRSHHQSYPEQHYSGSPPHHSPPQHSSPSAHHSPPHHPAPSADNPGSPISLSEENFYRDPSSRLSDHHLDDHSPDRNAGGGGRRLVALNPDEDT